MKIINIYNDENIIKKINEIVDTLFYSDGRYRLWLNGKYMCEEINDYLSTNKNIKDYEVSNVNIISTNINVGVVNIAWIDKENNLLTYSVPYIEKI